MSDASERFSYFWSHAEGKPLAECSQFYSARMTIEGRTFGCTEQWMHYRKARLFGDDAVAERIAAEAEPAAQKKLGREVAGFDTRLWQSVARDVVLRGNLAKFAQNRALLERLRPTCGSTLVEASPSDVIWGIGLAAADPLARDRATWRGTNWLGEVITEVRVALLGS